MKMLTVFYDTDCGICTGFRRWMMKEPAHLAIEFLPCRSRKAGELCKLISTNRLTLSRLLHLRSDREIAGTVNEMAGARPRRTSTLERAKLAVRKEKR